MVNNLEDDQGAYFEQKFKGKRQGFRNNKALNGDVYEREYKKIKSTENNKYFTKTVTFTKGTGRMTKNMSIESLITLLISH